MSRLDNELRNAFKRQQPPADFTARVLARVAQQPQPRLSWWKRIAALVEPPKLRWVAIGATASLLLAIGAAQYSRLSQKVVTDGGKISQAVPSPEKVEAASGSQVVKPGMQPEQQPSHDVQLVQKVRHSPRRTQITTAQIKKDQELRAEAEAAKEKLMFALSIASSALNDAQKAVHDDGPKP